MNLHLESEAFRELVLSTADAFNIDSEIVEKDYYVSLVLKKLNEEIEGLVFRGGTSLSKCFAAINRFSEDIDLTLLTDSGKASTGLKRKLKSAVIQAFQHMDAKHLNPEEVNTRMDYNKYSASYLSMGSNNGTLLVETCLSMRTYPYEIMPVNNYIHNFLQAEAEDSLITRYDLQPFDMKVQSLNRTFVDKVFAICDYYLDQVDKGQSRHIYDLHMLDQHVRLDDALRLLIEQVREDRRISPTHRPSAESDISVSRTLADIMESDFFMRDYNEVTTLLLFEPIPYSLSITQLQKIIDSGCFE